MPFMGIRRGLGGPMRKEQGFGCYATFAFLITFDLIIRKSRLMISQVFPLHAWRLQRCGAPPNALLAFKLLPHDLQLLSALGRHLREGHVELFQRLQNDVRDE